MINCIDYVINALSNILYAFQSWSVASGFYVIDLLYVFIFTIFIVYIFKRFAK